MVLSANPRACQIALPLIELIPMTKAEKIRELLTRNVEQIIERAHLEKALRGGRKLRVKLGIDPTGEKIHIGRAVALWKLREFQELGHKIVLIIGDFTAQIGDPSDKLEKRPFLSQEQVARNMKNYLPQIGKILDLEKCEVRYNSEWLAKLNFREIAELAESFSVNQMLRRHAFRERWQKDEDISLREFMYPLMQGYDSVAVRADVELGGTDQLFNLQAGRVIQKHYGQKPQDIMTLGMLLGIDGRKMSTSWGNVINITDPPEEQFGKLMSMRDEMIPEYFRAATRLPARKISDYERELKRGANPRDIKLVLAKEIVALYHGAAAAEKAAARWEKLFSRREVEGADLPALKIPKKISAAELVLKSGVARSRGEAWRLVRQGGLKVGKKTIGDPRQELNLSGGETIKVGKKHFFRIALE
jgi:tyrosyl-tRNA synthetase